MKKLSLALFFLLTSVLCAFSVKSALADFTLTPSLMVREEFNDNIYLTADHEEDDLITTISPSLKLNYEAKLVTLSLDYSLLTTFYVHNSKENDIYHRADLDALSNLYKDIVFLHITDTYSRVPIDEKRPTGLDSILSNMTDTNTFEVNPYIVYPLTPTLQLRADYIYEN
ncbi:MAG: TIGR03016 family PEP-CTERM system-associated outer membrane protein, partial [Nitrospirae bacterium]